MKTTRGRLRAALSAAWERLVAEAAARGLLQVWQVAPWGWTHGVVLTLCILVGAVVNPLRASWVAAPSAPTFRGFFVPDQQHGGQAVKWAREYAKVEYLDLSWRPLHIQVRLAGADELPAEGAPTLIRVNDHVMTRVVVRPGWQVVEVIVERPATTTVLQFNRDGPHPLPQTIGVGDIRVARRLDLAAIVRHGMLGALAGLIAGVFLLARLVGPADGGGDAASAWDASWRRVAPKAAITFAVLVGYLGCWAVVKPLMQAPDEPQHLLRANSVLRSTWADTPSELTLDPTRANPIAWMPPDGLGKLFFHRERQLTREEIDELERWPWAPTPLHWPTPLATYPAGYYGLVFALSEPVSAWWQLTPYQAAFAYRFWTVVVAAALWTAVYVVLLSLPETRRHAAVMLALVVLNPVLAFVTSSVTPDAVNNPLAALGLLLAYRTGVTGRHPWAATIALVACAFTKPSALLLLAAMAVAFAWLWQSRRLPLANAIPVTLAVGRAAVAAVVGFYAWSPPRFMAGPPVHTTLNGYLETSWNRLPTTWVTFWGKLGWLDYQLPAIWYQVLLILVLANLVAVRRRDAPFPMFAGLVLVTYIGLMAAGEFRWLALAGYNFQGRHMFPAIIAVGALAMHDHRWIRNALIGFVGVMGLMLAVETVERYFAGDWGLVLAALP